MRLTAGIAGLATILALQGCGGSSSSSTNLSTPRTATLTPAANVAVGDDVRVQQLNFTRTRQLTIEVPVAAGDVSFLLNLDNSNAQTAMIVTEIFDPSGTRIYQAMEPESDNEDPVVTGVLGDDPLSDEGRLSLLFPSRPEVTLATGTYRIVVASDNNGAIIRGQVTHKSGNDLDNTALNIDFNVVVASNSAAMRSSEYISNLRTGITNYMNSVLADHDLAIGQMNIQVANDALTRRIATTPADDLSDTCDALNDLFATNRAVNLAFVDMIEASPDDNGNTGSIAGVSAGLPGFPFNADSNNSCVIASIEAFEADDFVQHGANWLHEAGHFMGLPHTTEEDGTIFDLFADTPQCAVAMFDGRENNELPGGPIPGDIDQIVEATECGILGGANYIMFWQGIEEYSDNFILSDEQAAAFRLHPYWYVPR